ncbi:MAG: hypothetical protein IKW21_06090 [Lachnospiraceae bacterium]|nr:hypothetical protein [Lachnospiraceae bacterium]
MQTTANFGLKKPDENEFYDVNMQNDNMDEIDRVLQEITDGTQQVGDSAKLGGKDASEYALAESIGQGKSLSSSILEKALTLDAGSHDFSLSGGSYAGNDLPVSTYAYGMVTVFVRSKSGVVSVILWGTNTSNRQADMPYLNHYNAGAWTGWIQLANAANYLPLSGGNVDGLVKFLYGGVGEMYLFTHSIGGRLRYDNKQGIADLILTNENLRYMRDKNGVTSTYELLHTGNKPTGTYTGNGETGERVFQVGGIGSVCHISTYNHTLFVTSRGAIGVQNVNGASPIAFGSNQVVYTNGMIVVYDGNSFYNAEGSTYTYQVL